MRAVGKDTAGSGAPPLRIALLVPCRNEATTVAAVVAAFAVGDAMRSRRARS